MAVPDMSEQMTGIAKLFLSFAHISSISHVYCVTPPLVAATRARYTPSLAAVTAKAALCVPESVTLAGDTLSPSPVSVMTVPEAKLSPVFMSITFAAEPGAIS